MNEQGLDLLNSFMNLELLRFKDGKITPISKYGRVSECFNDIKAYTRTRMNSIFTIVSSKSNIGVTFTNVDRVNDHIKHYKISLAESCETYKVEEIVYLSTPILEIKKNYDESKV